MYINSKHMALEKEKKKSYAINKSFSFGKMKMSEGRQPVFRAIFTGF